MGWTLCGPSKASKELGFLHLPSARNTFAFLLLGFRSGILDATSPALIALDASLAQRKVFVGADSGETDCNLSKKNRSISSKRLWKVWCYFKLQRNQLWECGCCVWSVCFEPHLEENWPKVVALLCLVLSPDMWIHWRNKQLSAQACQNFLCRVILVQLFQGAFPTSKHCSSNQE